MSLGLTKRGVDVAAGYNPDGSAREPVPADFQRLFTEYESLFLQLAAGELDVDIPHGVIYATNSNSGDPNAITATTDYAIPDEDGGALIVLFAVAENTDTPVTVSFNGDDPLEIQTSATGADPVVGGITAGMPLVGLIVDGVYRLLSEQASGALLSQMEQILAEMEARALGAHEDDAGATAAAAGSPDTGTIYYNTTVGEIRVHNGTTWEPLASSTVPSGSVTIQKLSGSLRGRIPIATIADLEADAPSVDPDFYEVAFYDTNYVAGSGAKYRRAASEPSHAGKAQNRNGTWYELTEPVIRTSMVGGDLLAAIGVGSHVHIDADCSISDPAPIAKSRLKISATEGVTVTYAGSPGANAALFLTDVDHFIAVDPFTIDCASIAGIGIFVDANDGADLVEIRNITVNNAFQTGSATHGAAGIHTRCATGSGKRAIITHCTVGPVSRDIPGGTSTGITVTDFLDKTVEHNEIQGVSRGGGDHDADGIKIFEQISATGYEAGITSVRHNVISDCEGRFVKTQTRGKCAVKDNLFRFTKHNVLMDGHIGVDAQVGDTEIEDNTYDLNQPTTIDGSASFFVFSRPTVAPAKEGQIIRCTFINNTIAVRGVSHVWPRATWIDLSFLDDNAFDVRYKIEGNTIATDDGLRTDVAATQFIHWSVPTTWASGASAFVEISRNMVASSFFIGSLGASGGSAAHGGLGDLTNKLFLVVEDNISPIPTSPDVMEYSSNHKFTSSIRVSRNSVGLRGNKWAPPFDFSGLLPGSDLVIPGEVTPAHANAPATITDSWVRHSGRHIDVDLGVIHYISSLYPHDAPPLTWTEYTR